MADKLQERGKSLENEYFRRKEQEIIDKMKAKLESEEMVDLKMQCPKCDGHLLETEYEDITIDVCDKCSGVWLDAGELTQIVDKDKGEGFFGKMFG